MRGSWRLGFLSVLFVVIGFVVAPSAMAATAGSSHFGHPNVGVAAGQQASTTTGPEAGGSFRPAAYADRGVLPYGDSAYFGAPTSLSLNAPAVGMARTPDGRGYWLVAADGGVFGYGDAAFYGSAGAINLTGPIVGMASTPDGNGYWIVALDGGIFSYGDAKFYGSTGAIHLHSPIVGMASTPDGNGYWLVAADGGIFSFGDARFYGSTGAISLDSPIVGMASTPDGKGYWIVAADGGIFTFGDAPFLGSLGRTSLPGSVAGMASTTDGRGYWMAGSDGSVYHFGDAGGYGDNTNVSPTEVISEITASPDGKGYWLLEPDAFPTNFSHPGGGSAIVAAAASQIHADPDTGYFCNPYGPCEAWCALFATYAWEQGGVGIPRYAFVGDVYNWAASHTGVYGVGTTARPGDAVLYGTGPQSVYSAVHMAIVAQVWPDGAIITIDGDSGPAQPGHYQVTMNGPFLPSHSLEYNGFGIFAFARQ